MVERVKPSSLVLASSIAEYIFYTFAVIAQENVLLVGPLSVETL